MDIPVYNNRHILKIWNSTSLLDILDYLEDELQIPSVQVRKVTETNRTYISAKKPSQFKKLNLIFLLYIHDRINYTEMVDFFSDLKSLKSIKGVKLIDDL